jgi:hypothetical protein
VAGTVRITKAVVNKEQTADVIPFNTVREKSA